MEYTYGDLIDLYNLLKFNLDRKEYGTVKKNFDYVLKVISKDEWFFDKSDKKNIRKSIQIISGNTTPSKQQIKDISQSVTLIRNKLQSGFSEYKKQINRLKTRKKEHAKLSKRIIKLGELLNYDSKELSECLEEFRKTADLNYLNKRLLKTKTIKLYYEIESTKNLTGIIRFNPNIRLIPISNMRKILSKYKNYDLFINIYEGKLRSNLAFMEVSATHIFYKNINKILRNNYETTLDIISFLESELSYHIEYSNKRLNYFSLHNKIIFPGFNIQLSILNHIEYSTYLQNNFKHFNFLYRKNLHGMRLKIKNALKYFRKAKTSLFNEDILLNFIICLEALLLENVDWQKGSNPKDEIVISRIKQIIHYLPEYRNLPNQLEQIYKKRHGIVHNGRYDIEISKDELDYLRSTLYKILNRCLTSNKFKKLSNILKNIEKQKKDYYQNEKKRLTNVTKLNKSYKFYGTLFKNEDEVGNFKADIIIEDYPDTRLIDVKLKNFINKTVKVNSVNGADVFKVSGKFYKAKVEKVKTNLSPFNIMNLVNKNASKFILSDSIDMIRLMSSNTIEKS